MLQNKSWQVRAATPPDAAKTHAVFRIHPVVGTSARPSEMKRARLSEMRWDHRTRHPLRRTDDPSLEVPAHHLPWEATGRVTGLARESVRVLPYFRTSPINPNQISELADRQILSRQRVKTLAFSTPTSSAEGTFSGRPLQHRE